MYLKWSTVHPSPHGIPTLVPPRGKVQVLHHGHRVGVHPHQVTDQLVSPRLLLPSKESARESCLPSTVVCFPLFAPRRMWSWCLLIDKLCTDLPPVSRTKGHSESTSLLGAGPKSCAHCFVLEETTRFCGTSAEGFEYHDLREYRVSDVESTTAGTLAAFEPKRLVNGPC